MAKANKTVIKVAGIFFAFGIIFWLADTVYQIFYFKEDLNYMFSHEPLSILDSLIWDIPRNSMFYRFSFMAICIAGGILVGWLLKRSRERDDALRSSEKNLREAINAVNDGIFNYWVPADASVLSPQCYTMLGYEPDEFPVTREVWINMLHPDDREKTLASMNSCIEAGEPFSLEFRLKTKNNYWLWILCRGHVVEWDKAGKPMRITGTNTNIDNRVKTQQRLKEYTEKLEEAEKTAHLGHWEYDHIQAAWTWSNQVYNIIQFKDAVFTPTQKAPLQYIHPDDRSRVEEIFLKSLQNKTFFNHMHRLLLKDGSIKYVHERGIHIYDSNNKPVRSFGTIQDITETRRVEEALYDSERRYRTLFEGAGEGILVIDRESGKIKHANKTICQMLDYPPDEILRISLKDIHPEDSFEIDSQWFRMAPGEKIIFSEARCKRKDGVIIPTEINASAIELDGRKCSVGFFSDLTESRKIETERNILKFAVDNSAIEIFICNPDGACHYANTAAVNRMGCSREELKNTPILFINNNDNKRKESVAVIWENLKEIKTIRGESEQTHSATGNSFPIEYTVDYLSIGTTEYACVYIQDITERKRVEDEMVTAREKAEKSDKLKSIFLANMSHEIRTPMNGILGFAELIQRKDLTNEKRTEYAKIITECGNNLLQIINDILDISKIEAGECKIVKTDFSLNKMMEELYTFFEPLITQGGESRVSFEMRKSLRDDECIIHSDENRLRQILTNLLSNSMKFTSRGFINFGYFEKGNEIEFFVKDSGIGIPSDKQAAIFEPFRQAEETLSKKYRGTGLGLAIVKNFIKLLNGAIRLESEPGQGSCFTFTIPLERPARESLKEFRTSIMKTTIFNWFNKKILIVEDDRINFMLLHKLLEPTGAEILHAATAQESVDISLSAPLDIVLMDIRLPDFSGWEAAQIIKKAKPDLPIIVQTANAMTEDREKTFQYGCDGYVTKPISKSVLFNTIQSFMK
jgi:PAS domain S-box-containing protein